MYTLLLILSILPVIILMIYIYRQDKYQKEPIKSLAKAFIGGILAILVDIVLVTCINMIYQSDTVFYSAFLEAGIPEELSKLIIFLIFIWRDKNFDEYMDGIVYACFIGLGFACIENIMYVFEAAEESVGAGIGTGVVRALLSVPGHFLFGVVLGYFLALAKFGKKPIYILLGLLAAATCHGLFDWLLMASDAVGEVIGTALYIVFLWGDFKLWKLGVKYIRKQQENSRLQAEIQQDLFSADDKTTTDYKQIDWNAGFRDDQ